MEQTNPGKEQVTPKPASSTAAIHPGPALWAVVWLAVFGTLARGVWLGNEFAFDLVIMDMLSRLVSPWLTSVVRLVTHSASFVATTALALALSVHWWRQVERRADAIVLCATLAGSAALGQGLKLFFARTRPYLFPWRVAATGWSFPSGHTLNAVVLAGLLAWLVGRRLRGWRRVVFDAGVALWALLVGLSRIYLGVHYPSDVLAGLAVGGLCLLTIPAGVRICRRPGKRAHDRA